MIRDFNMVTTEELILRMEERHARNDAAIFNYDPPASDDYAHHRHFALADRTYRTVYAYASQSEGAD